MIPLVWVFGPEEDSVPKNPGTYEASVAGAAEDVLLGGIVFGHRKRRKS